MFVAKCAAYVKGGKRSEVNCWDVEYCVPLGGKSYEGSPLGDELQYFNYIC